MIQQESGRKRSVEEVQKGLGLPVDDPGPTAANKGSGRGSNNRLPHDDCYALGCDENRYVVKLRGHSAQGVRKTSRSRYCVFHRNRRYQRKYKHLPPFKEKDR